MLASHIVTPQGCGSKTFIPPDFLSGNLTLPQAWDILAQTSPDHILFRLSTASGVPREITWRQSVKAFHRAARYIQRHVGSSDSREGAQRPVIGVLANTDSTTYHTILAGALRAEYLVFPISSRNSAQGVTHLLTKTSCTHVFVTSDPAMNTLVEATAKCIREAGQELEVHPMPSFSELFDAEDDVEILSPMSAADMDTPAMILHSSGSTAFPKPIPFTHKVLLQWAYFSAFGEMDLCGHTMSWHCIPMYHGMGATQLMWPAVTGLVVACFDPSSHPKIPTAETVLEGALQTKTSLIFAVPAFVEQWSQSADTRESLKSFRHIVFGGAPLSERVGDALVQEGVSLVPFYGMTEGGLASTFLPERCAGKNWQYFKISPRLNPRFVPYDESGMLCELVLLDHDTCTPSVFNTTIDGLRGYATSDLLLRHPDLSDRWKVYGRADDQIMLSTGEKTNPGPIESFFDRDPRIRSAVMFGRGRFQSGIILELTPEASFDPRDLDRLSRFRSDIWPVVEQANDFAPQHSRLFKEMILVANPTKPFEYTPKNTPRRPVVLAAYEQEIDAAYEAVKESSQEVIPSPIHWKQQETLAFIRSVVNSVMKGSVKDGDDLFQHGCDSLQATWIRNTILRGIRETSKQLVQSMPHSFVYQHPTISSLAHYVASVANSNHANGTANGDAAMAKREEMDAMVAKYTGNWRRHSGSLSPDGGEVVLLTGSTGNLGAHILVALRNASSVKHIYLLNRSGSRPSAIRQREILQDRGYDADEVLVANKVTTLEGDTGDEFLGVGPDQYEVLRTTVTTVIHNAWRVDFNLALSSFEPNVRGVRNLIDLALSSPFATPPRVMFISSIGVYQMRHAESDRPASESPVENLKVQFGSGYSHSKWVSEQIIEAASTDTPLRAVVVRVHQVAGGKNGAWNTWDWLPALVKSSVEMKCVPDVIGNVSWLPATVAGVAIAEMTRSEDRYLNLAHPRPTPWHNVASVLSQHLKISLVPYVEWLKKLETSAESAQDDAAVLDSIPAVKLLDFFRSIEVDVDSLGTEALGLPAVETKHAVRNSFALAALENMPLSAADVQSWLRYWSDRGFLAV